MASLSLLAAASERLDGSRAHCSCQSPRSEDQTWLRADLPTSWAMNEAADHKSCRIREIRLRTGLLRLATPEGARYRPCEKCKGRQIVPLETFAQIEIGKDRKYDQGDHF